MLYSWRFSHYSALIHWLLHGHMKSNKSNFFRPNNITGENYDVKREKVHYYPQNVDRCCTWSERAVEGGLMLSLESQHVFQNLLLFCFAIKQIILLWSWLFSRNSTPIHWLVHGQMTSNNETVSRQMPWADNIAKTMTSNGTGNRPAKCWQAVPRDQRWPDTVAGISARASKFAFVLFRYITNNRISLFPSTSSRETLRFSGNKIHCSPRAMTGPSGNSRKGTVEFSNLNVSSTSSRETLRFWGNKIHCSPQDQPSLRLFTIYPKDPEISNGM